MGKRANARAVAAQRIAASLQEHSVRGVFKFGSELTYQRCPLCRKITANLNAHLTSKHKKWIAKHGHPNA